MGGLRCLVVQALATFWLGMSRECFTLRTLPELLPDMAY